MGSRDLKLSASALCFTLACSLFAVSQPTLAAPKTSDQNSKGTSQNYCQGYKASQYHLVTGAHQITYCPRGMRDDYLKHNVSMVALPPTWEAYTFNRQTMLCYKAKPSEFTGYLHPQVAFTTGRSLQSIVSIPCGKSKKFGFKTITFKTPASESKLYLEQYQKTRSKHGAILAVNYEITRDLALPEAVSSLLAETFGILNKNGFPVEITYKNVSEDEHNYLNTSKLAPTKINMQDFELPKGLKFVSNINRVFNNTDGLDAEKYLMDY